MIMSLMYLRNNSPNFSLGAIQLKCKLLVIKTMLNLCSAIPRNVIIACLNPQVTCTFNVCLFLVTLKNLIGFLPKIVNYNLGQIVVVILMKLEKKIVLYFD